MRIWFSGRKLSTTNPTRRPPSPSCSKSSPSAAAFRAPSSPSTRSPAIPQSPAPSATVGADYLLAVKGNQPTLKAEIEAAFQTAMAKDIEVAPDIDKGHGRIETRLVSVMRQVDWLHGDRRFPGELRFPDACAIVRIDTRTELKDRCRFDARYYITSSARSAARLGEAGRGHWGIENKLHWTLDVTFQEDFSRVRKGHGAQNMALVRKFSINKLRTAPQPQKPANLPVKPCRKPKKPPPPMGLKLRRKLARWSDQNLAQILLAT